MEAAQSGSCQAWCRILTEHCPFTAPDVLILMMLGNTPLFAIFLVLSSSLNVNNLLLLYSPAEPSEIHQLPHRSLTGCAWVALVADDSWGQTQPTLFQVVPARAAGTSLCHT